MIHGRLSWEQVVSLLRYFDKNILIKNERIFIKIKKIANNRENNYYIILHYIILYFC